MRCALFEADRQALFADGRLFIYQKEQKEKKGCKNRTTDIATARQSARCFFFLGDKRSVRFQFLAFFRFLTSLKTQNRPTVCDLFHAQKGVK
jgi:hypothetical protein